MFAERGFDNDDDDDDDDDAKPDGADKGKKKEVAIPDSSLAQELQVSFIHFSLLLIQS